MKISKNILYKKHDLYIDGKNITDYFNDYNILYNHHTQNDAQFNIVIKGKNISITFENDIISVNRDRDFFTGKYGESCLGPIYDGDIITGYEEIKNFTMTKNFKIYEYRTEEKTYILNHEPSYFDNVRIKKINIDHYSSDKDLNFSFNIKRNCKFSEYYIKIDNDSKEDLISKKSDEIYNDEDDEIEDEYLVGIYHANGKIFTYLKVDESKMNLHSIINEIEIVMDDKYTYDNKGNLIYDGNNFLSKTKGPIPIDKTIFNSIKNNDETIILEFINSLSNTNIINSNKEIETKCGSVKRLR
tara:strand:- start:544 stop:1443 length:900 start_codon:yes stop_codon:yes gene_type:complete